MLLKRITFPLVSFSAALVLLVNSSLAQADTVWLTNGDRLSGTVRYLSDGKLGLDTTYAGTVTLNWSAVSTLASDNPVTVQNKVTGEGYQVRLSSSDPGYVWVEKDEQEEKVSTQRIDEFMKAKVRTDQLAWTGNIDAGVNIKKASTNTQDYNLSFNNKVSKGNWRHNFGGTFDREEEDNSVNTDNYSLRYALDYRLREQYFWQMRASYKRDWIEDLSRQTLLGTGPGYQFWDNELGSFSLSFLGGGFGYGYSDGTEDNHFGASLRWSYQRYLRGKTLTLYSNGDVGHSLDDDAIFTMDAEVGLRYALTSWSTLNIGYHHNLVSGTRDTLNERQFTTGLGVKW